MVERLEEMANAMLERLKQLQRYKRKQKQLNMDNSISGTTRKKSSFSSSTSTNKHGMDIIDISVESILSNIQVFRVHDYAKQIAVVKTLPSFFRAHSNIRLVVMDSVAFHF